MVPDILYQKCLSSSLAVSVSIESKAESKITQSKVFYKSIATLNKISSIDRIHAQMVDWKIHKIFDEEQNDYRQAQTKPSSQATPS